MTDAPSTNPSRVLTFREGLVAIAYLGFGFVYLHLTALWCWHVLKGDQQWTFVSYAHAGVALLDDLSWVIPTAVGLIIASYVALFGDARMKLPGSAQDTKDLAVLTSLAIAAILLGYATTASVGVLTSPGQAARAFPVIGFTIVAVLLAAKAGTAFWGNTRAQVRSAARDEADIRLMLSQLPVPRTTKKSRTIATLCWTLIPAAAFAATVGVAESSLEMVLVLVPAGFAVLVLTAWGFGWFTRSRMISGQWLTRFLTYLFLGITTAAIILPFVTLWSLAGSGERIVLAVLTVLIVGSALIPLRLPYTIRGIARDRAYLRLSRRLAKAKGNTLNARARQRMDQERKRELRFEGAESR
jgi:hypothetical protein